MLPYQRKHYDELRYVSAENAGKEIVAGWHQAGISSEAATGFEKSKSDEVSQSKTLKRCFVVIVTLQS